MSLIPFEVVCPRCGTTISVGVPLGTLIWRAKDKALLAHYREHHDNDSD